MGYFVMFCQFVVVVVFNQNPESFLTKTRDPVDWVIPGTEHRCLLGMP